MNRYLTALLLVLLLAPGTALAHEDSNMNHTHTPTPTLTTNSSATSTSTATATPTPSSRSSNVSAVASIDRLTVVTDYFMHRGDLVIKLYSTGPNKLAITETTNEDGAVQVRVRDHNVPRGHSRVRIDVIDRQEPSVLITTRLSLMENTGTKVSIDNSESIIEGPYDETDVRDAGIGGALGVALAVLYEAVRVKFAARNRGERLA